MLSSRLTRLWASSASDPWKPKGTDGARGGALPQRHRAVQPPAGDRVGVPGHAGVLAKRRQRVERRQVARDARHLGFRALERPRAGDLLAGRRVLDAVAEALEHVVQLEVVGEGDALVADHPPGPRVEALDDHLVAELQ